MKHPFADLLAIKRHSSAKGESHFSIIISEQHMNPHNVVHGGVMYSLADNGMGGALYPLLSEEETCATIEIKINYFRPVRKGELNCMTKVVYKGRKIANLESELFNDKKLVAKASGTFAVISIN